MDEKDAVEGKEKKKRKLSLSREHFAVIAILVFLILLAFRLNGIEKNANDRIDQVANNTVVYVDAKFHAIGAELSSADDKASVNEADVFQLKKEVADVWFTTLSPDAYDKAIANANEIPTDCLKFKDLWITRTYYSQKIGPHAQYLVIKYDGNDVVYDRNGDAKCYNTPIFAYDPTPINCKTLCMNTTAAQ